MRTAIYLAILLLLGGCTLLLLNGCAGIKALEVLTQEVERQPLDIDADATITKPIETIIKNSTTK